MCGQNIEIPVGDLYYLTAESSEEDFSLKKLNLLILIVCIMLLTACHSNNIDEKSQTGYEANEIEQPQIMYNDRIYYYGATGFDEKLPEEYRKAGVVEHVDNENPPSENFSGARVDIGQEIYDSDNDESIIYVGYENGFARFSLKIENQLDPLQL